MQQARLAVKLMGLMALLAGGGGLGITWPDGEGSGYKMYVPHKTPQRFVREHVANKPGMQLFTRHRSGPRVLAALVEARRPICGRIAYIGLGYGRSQLSQRNLIRRLFKKIEASIQSDEP